MSAMIANFIQLLPYNFKPAKVTPGFSPGNIFVPNKMIQARLADCPAKGFQLVAGAFRGQFHSPAGQVTHRAGHVEAGGDRFRGVPEPDALHVARIKNLHSPATYSIHPSKCATVGPLPGAKSPRRRF